MDRREFVKQSCFACLSGGVISLSLTGCASTHYIPGALETDGINVSKTDFIFQKQNQTISRQYVVVQNDILGFPIYLYRFSENEFSALWMQCSHQGNELQAFGDQLHCPAHGSEFDNKGKVSQGPASHPLRSFPVKVDGDKIFIDLRAA